MARQKSLVEAHSLDRLFSHDTLGSGQVLFASISRLQKPTQKVKSQQPFSKYYMPTSHARDLLHIIE